MQIKTNIMEMQIWHVNDGCDLPHTTIKYIYP